MRNQITPVLLILMMLITPIASAFDHCSGMDMMAHLSVSQSLTVTMSISNEAPINQQRMLDSDNTNPVDMDCQASNSCTFHGCGGYGITSSVSTVDTVISLNYSHFEYLSPYDSDLSPDLKPPIMVL